jgi:hypothetical protein
MRQPDRELLRGAIDTHAHTSPALFPRLLDDADLARVALDYGMRGFVLKDHDASTTGRAYYVKKMYPGVEPVSAIVLNRSVGGLDPHVAQAAIHYGARVVWMPTNHSRYHEQYFDMSDYPRLGRMKKQIPGPGVTVFDEDGNLKQEALAILDICKEEDVAVATGHLALDEIRTLLDAAVARGIDKFIVTHANWSLSKLDVSVQRELIDKGAWLEYVACTISSPVFHEQQPEELAAWIDELGGERLLFGSDLGQYAGPPHPEGLRMTLAMLLTVGVNYDELEKMTKRNPALVLGLQA